MIPETSRLPPDIEVLRKFCEERGMIKKIDRKDDGHGKKSKN